MALMVTSFVNNLEESPNEASQETNNERVKGDLKEWLFGEHDKMNRSFWDNFTVTVRNTSLNTVERTLNLKLGISQLK